MVFGLGKKKKTTKKKVVKRKTAKKKVASRRTVKRKTAARRTTAKKRTSKRKTTKKGKAFGGYKINPDENFAKIVGNKAVTPSEMTKKVWQYIKRRKLATK
ncbi:MAG: hypothetical protein JW700_00010 [Candidatus Aenigmarchaeota archaeon]|nr:hypothetical protein [Candidatus Aenigmarchaeota archaeon]